MRYSPLLFQMAERGRGKGKVSEKDIKDAMREVRMALLEADVNFKVAKELINKISEKALRNVTRRFTIRLL